MMSISSDNDIETWAADAFNEPNPFSYCLEKNFSATHSDLHNLEAHGKKLRSGNWSPEERQRFLEAKVEGLRTVKGKVWEFTSQRLRERHGIKRSPKNCEHQWGTLVKVYKPIREHESLKSDPEQREWVSYWRMNEDGRSKNNLPRLFPQEWYKMIEEIHIAQGKRSRISDPAGTSNAKDSGRKDVGAKFGDIADHVKLRLGPFVKQEVNDQVNCALQSLPCRDTLGATPEQDEIVIWMALLAKQQVESAVLYALQVLAVTGFNFDEDDAIPKLASYVRDRIKGALDSALQPLSSALQVRAQNEQKDQERLQAIEEEKRALDLEEMQIKRQCVGLKKYSSAGRSSRH